MRRTCTVRLSMLCSFCVCHTSHCAITCRFHVVGLLHYQAAPPSHLPRANHVPFLYRAAARGRHARPGAGRARLVEELHHDKGVEDQCVVHAGALHGGSRGHPEQRVAVEDERIHGHQLERALACHRLQHLAPRGRSIVWGYHL